MIESSEPRVESSWRRLTDGVRRQLNRLQASGGTAGAVEEYIGVLPVLAGQVRETASQIERSVLDLSGSFASLVERARRAVSSARGAGATDAAGGNVDELIASSRQTLQQLLDHSIRSARLSMEAVARMEDVVSAMKVIGSTTKEVDRVAFGIRILALNAKIESVHVGERGAGFAVVADEISHHADQASAIAEGIRGTVTGLEGHLGLAMHNLRQLAEADMTSLTEDKDKAERVIGLLDAGNAAMRRELEASALASEQLAEDVSRAVVAMQFQDRVNQRLQHVAETLSEMQDGFVAALARPGERLAPVGSAVMRLRQRYTMAEERDVERPGAVAVAGPPADTTVELLQSVRS